MFGVLSIYVAMAFSVAECFLTVVIVSYFYFTIFVFVGFVVFVLHGYWCGFGF